MTREEFFQEWRAGYMAERAEIRGDEMSTTKFMMLSKKEIDIERQNHPIPDSDDACELATVFWQAELAHDLLAALRSMVGRYCGEDESMDSPLDERARAAIAKALGND